jgi:hypothetical protein
VVLFRLLLLTPRRYPKKAPHPVACSTAAADRLTATGPPQRAPSATAAGTACRTETAATDDSRGRLHHSDCSYSSCIVSDVKRSRHERAASGCRMGGGDEDTLSARVLFGVAVGVRITFRSLP